MMFVYELPGQMLCEACGMAMRAMHATGHDEALVECLSEDCREFGKGYWVALHKRPVVPVRAHG